MRFFWIIFPAPHNNPTALVSFFYNYSASLPSLLRLFNLSLLIPISSVLSCKEPKFSIITSLFFGSNVNFEVNLWLNVHSSFRKHHINISFLLKTFNVCLALALTVLLGWNTNLSPFESREVSDFFSCLCDKLITFLLTNFPASLLSFNSTLLSAISWATSESLLFIYDSIPLAKEYVQLTSSLSLFSRWKYKCLCVTKLLT